MAFTATQRTPDKFTVIFRFVITPLFLFSGTFFPIETLPAFLQPIAWLSPLWHGVDADARAVVFGVAGERAGPDARSTSRPGRDLGRRHGAAVRTIERRLVRG